ncbi:MAG TPA: PhzF family phenazine biosynthesis protein [Methylococcaceae bacterium]|nr:PhzF family phenazine biosynthesis protein [Methylococcaceae bacterium]HIA44371.1 PhzF family phenazine biosynthesis protein [Methylococcaceae bacterium]HIN68471.1 PhzF family phenazine biosynthesis protein [Methylococcales bacterium]HIO44191.1 PhzF family phenazine biosynthesis protein [Methylococcales bacterium]
MNCNFYITDVFTKQAFGGAQVAVFPDASGLEKEQMAIMAKELNLTESVFVMPPEETDDSYRMYVFTPNGEVDFSGHPIIATGFVLASSGIITLEGTNTALTLQQNVGPIDVTISGEWNRPEFVRFSRQFSSIVDRFAPRDVELAQILSIAPELIDNKHYTARLVFCGAPYLVVPVHSYEAVREARFDFNAWSQSVAPQTTAQEVLLFSRKSAHQDIDFHCRLLGSKIAHYDDPPVGTAMPALAAYLCSYDHIREGTYTFSVDRGEAKNRRSVLSLEMDKKAKQLKTLRLGGEAVLVAEGSMKVPEL